MKTEWNGLPKVAHINNSDLHVISSALGRDPQVFAWIPSLQNWRDSRTGELVSPVSMSGRTYVGRVVKDF